MKSRQIRYSLYWAKEITPKVYKNINAFNKVIKQNGYYIYEFCETPDLHRLLFNLSNKLNAKRKGTYVALSNLTLRKKCTNMELFLVRIFLYSEI